MRWIVCLAILSLSLSVPLSVAADSVSLFATGDVQLDGTLTDLNLKAKADLAGFKADLAVSYSASPAAVNGLFEKERMQPAEAFLALELAFISRQPLVRVVEIYRKNRGQGWGVVAQSLGIKPGSAAFKDLKQKGRVRAEKMKSKKTGIKETGGQEKRNGKPPDREKGSKK